MKKITIRNSLDKDFLNIKYARYCGPNISMDTLLFQQKNELILHFCSSFGIAFRFRSAYKDFTPESYFQPEYNKDVRYRQ